MLLSLPAYTLIHVLLSVFGIVSGLVVVGGFMSGVFLRRWVGVFLTTTFLTSVTGFGFPFTTILPPHVFGVLSIVALIVAIVALQIKHLQGAWRQVFVGTSTFALYLNTFVLLAQLLQKTPPLAILAPGPGAPAFAITQGIALAVFVVLGRAAVRGFQNARN